MRRTSESLRWCPAIYHPIPRCLPPQEEEDDRKASSVLGLRPPDVLGEGAKLPLAGITAEMIAEMPISPQGRRWSASPKSLTNQPSPMRPPPPRVQPSKLAQATARATAAPATCATWLDASYIDYDEVGCSLFQTGLTSEKRYWPFGHRIFWLRRTPTAAGSSRGSSSCCSRLRVAMHHLQIPRVKANTAHRVQPSPSPCP